MNTKIYEMFSDYINAEISIIPCKTLLDEKKKIYSGKFSAVSGWQRYCQETPLDEEIKQWSGMSNISGMAIMTGVASNIACIDIDTEDPELIERLKRIIPYTPCVITGNKKRGGKFLYRLFENHNEHKEINTQKIAIKDPHNNKKTLVDIFYGNSYICAPPSLHSEDMYTKKKNYYEWENEEFSLLKVGVENLPVLDRDFIEEKIRMCIKGMTPSQMVNNLPSGGINLSEVGETGGRWQELKRLAGQLIAKRSSFDDAVIELMEHDERENSENPYFSDKTKGCNFKSIQMNATQFYFGILSSVNRGKYQINMELPKLREISRELEIKTHEWNDPISFKQKNKIPKFNFDLIPNKHIRDMVKTGSEVNGVSPQSIFFYMLGSLSSLIGNKIEVQPYHLYKDFKETANLYIGLIGASGERKSETTNFALEPLKRLNKKLKSERKAALASESQRIKDIETKISKLSKDRDREIEEVGIDSELSSKILDEIHELELKKPKIKNISLYEQETTIQKLYEIVEENNDGIFIEFNEWGSKYHALLSKDRSEERQFILNGWDGKRPFTYRTKHQGENEIDKLCLSVGFSCQVDVIDSILWRIQNVQQENDGLMQRFLLICSDEDRKPVVDSNYEISKEVCNIFENAYYIESKKEPVKLTNKSYNRWMNFQERTKDRIISCENSILGSVYSKYDGLVIRLAICLEVLKNDGNRPNFISDEIYQIAEDLIEYCALNAEHLYSGPKLKKYDEIVTLFKMSIIPEEISVRDLYKKHTRLFGNNADEAMQVLKVLFEHNIIGFFKDRKSDKVRVNPKLIQ